MIINTKCGKILGKVENGYKTYKGIPYGKAKRFQKPKPFIWDNVLDCTKNGKKAMQIYETKESKDAYGEDCLNLSIYGPITQNKKLPVLVYIHGGRFQTGSSQDIEPSMILRENEFLLVSIEYRLGIWGYLYLGNMLGDEYASSGNCGTLDQKLAIKWIYDNIEAFGGDKDKITLWGASAGAKSIAALLICKDVSSCFKQVMLASGAIQSIRTKETAAIITKRFFSKNNIDNMEELLTMSADQLLIYQKLFCAEDGNTCYFGPVADDIVIPKDWERIMREEVYWEGNAIIGSCLHELGGYQSYEGDFCKYAPILAERLFGDHAKFAIDEYKEWRIQKGIRVDNEEAKQYWIMLLSDYMYRFFSFELAKNLSEKNVSVWVYSFEFGEATHCMDQVMAFYDFDTTGFQQNTQYIMKDLAEKMYHAYIQFVITGNPNQNDIITWHRYKKEAPAYMIWNQICRMQEQTQETTHHRFPATVFQLSK